MAINANHPFEELNGIRCAVVEKNCAQPRVDFLKYILEGNGFEVVIVASPPPKAAPAAAAKPAAAAAPAEAGNTAVDPNAAAAPAPGITPPGSTPAPIASASASETPSPAPVAAPPAAPETFTVGVTDVTFNAINAIYGRLLRSPDGRVVTMAYWQQKESQSHDDVPYYAR